MNSTLAEELVETIIIIKSLMGGLKSGMEELKVDITNLKDKQKAIISRINQMESLERKMESAAGDVEVLKDSSVSRTELKKFKTELKRLKKNFSEIGILEVD